MKATHHFNSHYATILGVLPAILLQIIFDQISYLHHAQKGKVDTEEPRPKGQGCVNKLSIPGSNLALLGVVDFMSQKQLRLAKEKLLKLGYIEYKLHNNNKFNQNIEICLSDNLHIEMIENNSEKTNFQPRPKGQGTSIYNIDNSNNTISTLVTTPKRARLSTRISSLDIQKVKNKNGSYRIVSVNDKKNPDRIFSPAEKYALWCWLHIADNFVNYKFVKDANLEAWAKEIEILLKQIDNRTDEMIKIFIWAINDREKSGTRWNGWWQQIRSTAKFRAKYEELKIKWESLSPIGSTVQNTASYTLKQNNKMTEEINRIIKQKNHRDRKTLFCT